MANNIDNKAFDMMTTAADKTNVSLFPPPNKKPITSDDAHTALMVAGMTPGIGTAADIVDAALYLLEGRFGQAALAALAAVPVFGLFASGGKAGKKSYRLYRGITEPLEDTGDFIRSTTTSRKGRLFTSLNPRMALERFSQIEGGQVLKFNVPLNYIKKHGVADVGFLDETAIYFERGLPSRFLDRTIKTSDITGPLSFQKAFGKKAIKDVKQSKVLFDKILDNPTIAKNTMNDMLTTMGKEVDNLEDLVGALKKNQSKELKDMLIKAEEKMTSFEKLNIKKATKRNQ